MEQDAREAGTVSRGQNVVYVMPHDWTSIGQFLSPAVERLDETIPVVQLLLITSDADVAAVTAAAAVKLSRGRDLGIVAATSARRAASLLRAGPAQIVAGTPETIVDLLKATALKVDGVRAACIVWADELVTRGASAALETLMAELPKEGARIVVTAELTAAVEELLERYARRARRVVAVEHESDRPVNLEYVTVSAHARLSSLRRLIDEADPRSAVVFVRDSESTREVRDLLRALGYCGDSAAVPTGLVAPPDTDLVVLFDLPASREELREVGGGAKRRSRSCSPGSSAVCDHSPQRRRQAVHPAGFGAASARPRRAGPCRVAQRAEQGPVRARASCAGAAARRIRWHRDRSGGAAALARGAVGGCSRSGDSRRRPAATGQLRP